MAAKRLFAFSLLFLSLQLQGAAAVRCGLGEYEKDGNCTQCAPGRYQSSSDHQAVNCTACVSGHYSPMSGMSECWKCPRGSSSSAQAASCSMNLACQPCTDRTSVKVRAVLHGRTTDDYFLRIERAMRTAAEQLKVDFKISLQDRVSKVEFMNKINDTLKERPDLLLVSIPDAEVGNKVLEAAQETHVFSINKGIAEFKDSGSVTYFGVDDYRSGHDSVEYFAADFAGSTAFRACAAVSVDASGLAEQNLRRRLGFQRACNESGRVWVGDALAPSSAEVEGEVRNLLLQFRDWAPTAETGLGLLVLSGEGTQGTFEAYAAVGSPSDVRLGLYDASDAAYDALGAQAAFLIRDNEWLQGYLSVILGVIYVTTGNLMAIDVYRTEEFVTSRPSQDKLNQIREGYPTCDCPWAGGKERDMVCRASAGPIGVCPKADAPCALSCRDPRQVSIAAVTHGDESDPFWYIVKAGAEQAANDLRLQNFSMDLFGEPDGNRNDRFSPEFFSQTVHNISQRDDLDGLIVSVPGNYSHDAISEAAKRVLLVTVNSGGEVAATLNPPSGHWFAHIGQPEEFAGRRAGEIMLQSGVTHLLTISFYRMTSVMSRIRGVNAVFQENGKQVEDFAALDTGISSDNDDELYDAIRQHLMGNPTIDGIIFMGLLLVGPGLQAVKSTREPGSVVLGCFDVSEPALEDMDQNPNNKYFAFAIDQQPYMQGYMSVLAIWLRSFTGLRLRTDVIQTGPFFVRQRERSKNLCMDLAWTARAEHSGDVVVGEGLLPSMDARLTVGFPVCPYGGDCRGSGQFFNSTALACDLCPAGRFKNASMSACQDCPPGSSTSGLRGSGQCQTCTPGTAAQQGAPDCSNCQRGSYADSRGMASCASCPEGLTTADIVSMSPAACGCYAGSFFNDGGCHPCLEGMTCAQGSNLSRWHMDRHSGDYPLLLPGYWASGEDPLSVFECSDNIACPGGDPGSCGSGLEGRACQHCQDRFHWLPAEGVCGPCPPNTFLSLLLPVLLFLATVPMIGVLYRTGGDPFERWGSWQNGTASIGFVALVHYQMISLIGKTSVSHQSAELLSKITAPWAWTNDFFLLFNASCAGFASMRRRLLGQALLPMTLLLTTLSVFFTSYVFARLRQSPEMRLNHNRLINVYMSVIFTFFSAITASSLLLFQCAQNPNGQQTLAADRSILCFQGGDWMGMLVIAITAVFVYVVVCGAVYIWAIIRAPRLFMIETFRVRWKFLFLKFRADAYWWSLVFLGKTFLLNLTFVVSTWAPVQLLMIISINMIYAAALSTQSPHRFRAANWLDIQSSFSVIWVCSGALYITEHGKSREAQGGEDKSGLAALVTAAQYMSFVHMFFAFLFAAWTGWHRRFKASETTWSLPRLSQSMFLAVSRIEEQEWRDFCATVDELDLHSIYNTAAIINAEFFDGFSRTSTGKFRQKLSSLEKTLSGRRTSLSQAPALNGPPNPDHAQSAFTQLAKVPGLAELDRYVQQVII